MAKMKNQKRKRNDKVSLMSERDNINNKDTNTNKIL